MARTPANGAARAVRFFVAALIAGVIVASASAQLSRTGQLLDRIVVIVNDGVVLQSEIDRQSVGIVARLKSGGMQIPPREVLEKQVIERLIIDRIQLQRSERLGIQISDDQLNSALSTVAQRNNMSLSELPKALASQGLDYVEYRDEIRREMVIEQLRNRDLVPRISITRKEVEEYQKRKGGSNNKDYEISHILISVPPGASPEERDAAQARANEVYERVNNGDEFAQLAIAYSNGQQALQGGKIGWRKAEQLPTLFVDFVVAMADGEVSKPIPSGSGFHIVKLDATRGAKPVIVTQRKARHILISANELKTDADVQAQLTDLAEQIRNGADFAELAKEHSDDKGTAARGGELDWAGPGTFVPQFEAQLRELSPGQMSDPFRSPFGWHVVELQDIREVDRSEEASLNEAYAEVRARKLQQETESWLLRLRDEAFVDYRT